MSNEPKVYPDPRTDRLAMVVRGVCGAILGLGVGVRVWLGWGGLGAISLAVWLACGALVCAVCAIRYGDAFWRGILRRGR